MIMLEAKNSSNEISISQRKKGFHEKYLAICKIKLLQPLPEVKTRQRNIQLLDFHADRIKVNDWLAICGALQNDRTLKYVSIRLRKNDELVLENVDTLKKSKLVTSIPVIYSKFVLNELVESLQSMLAVNNILEILTLEGLPFGERYMVSLAKGLYSNRSIKMLNLSRSNIGDEGCEVLCSNVKHLANVETLNISHCNLGVKGACSVRDFIKFQKIHRFSEAWIRSLRYQDIEATSFGGLKKILLNNNPQIGDEGLKLLTDELCEDVWIKDIEMQNCGLTDIAAEHIVNCLNINKTILSFNVANNTDLPDHMYRQIMMRLGSCEIESDSSDSKCTPKKHTRSQLIDKIKYLSEQLESEVFKREQAEALNDQLQNIIENQKQLVEIKNQELQKIPDGYRLVANDDLERLVIGANNASITRKSAAQIAVKLRRKRRNPIKKVQSLVIESPINKIITSKSEASMKICRKPKSSKKKPFIERNIGDTLANNNFVQVDEKEDDEDGMDLLQMFIKTETSADFNFQSLFKKIPTRAPQNSEIESDE